MRSASCVRAARLPEGCFLMTLIMLVLAVVVAVLTLLLASALGVLVFSRPTLTAPVQTAVSSVAAMVALMAVLVAVTR